MKIAMKSVLTVAVLAMAFLAVPAQAAILANYSSDNLDPTSEATGIDATALGGTASPAVADQGVNVGNYTPTATLTNGAGFTLSQAVGTTTTDEPKYSFGADNVVDATYSDSLYIDFSLTADAGYTVSFDELYFNMRKSSNSNSRNTAITYSTDGTDFDLIGKIENADGSNNWGLFTADISSISDISGGETITFRLNPYVFGDTASDAMKVIFNDITVTGTAIPEPATLGLLAVGGLAAIRRRRR